MTRMERPLVHALIGCGRIAPNHLRAFRAVADVEVRWACDRDPLRAETFGQESGIPRWTTEVDKVLEDPEVTCVSVNVDHGQHARMTQRALAAGKHVLVEKPFATSHQDAVSLAAMADRCGLLLSVVSQHRYDPVVEAVEGWIAAGLLGTATQASAVLECHRNREYYSDYWHGTRAGEGGSALINQGYHVLDVLRALCGDLQVKGAVAGAAVLGDVIENEDTLAAVLTGPTGLAVTYSVTVTSTVEWRSRIGITGTAGSVELDIDHPGRLHFCAGVPELLERADTLRASLRDDPATGVNYYGDSHRHQIAEFCAAIRGGGPVRASAAEGLATLRLIEDLYAAAGRRPGLEPALGQA